MNIPKPRQARLIAFYLPQYHPIPENDEWWGEGFTEWANVTRAKPLYPGHKQPNFPSELGYYDLRVPETRLAQAQLAREHGIEGFCYWHYWFGNGKRILERPFNEVLASGQPDLPFCLAWANQTWTGVWHGNPGKILIEQTYPGISDFRAHFFSVLPALVDDRYIAVDGKPLFIVYQPHELPNPRLFTDYWRELACEAGLNGLYLVGVRYGEWNPDEGGFDAAAPTHVMRAFKAAQTPHIKRSARIKTALAEGNRALVRSRAYVMPRVIPYERAAELCLVPLSNEFMEFPTAIPNWDNTPRSGTNGIVFEGSTPELFGAHLRSMIKQVEHRDYDKRIVFLKSWNEWAEGNYLEPDDQFGRGYLEVIRREITDIHANR